MPLRRLLIGAGLGTLGGAAAGAAGAQEGERLRGATRGALVGGGLGAVGGALSNLKGVPSSLPKPPTPPIKPLGGAPTSISTVMSRPLASPVSAATRVPSASGTLATRVEGLKPAVSTPTTFPLSSTLPSAGSTQNLTRQSGEAAAGVYRKLSPNIQAGLEGTPLVRAGVPPEMAMQLAAMSRQKGESRLQAIARHAVQESPTMPSAAVSSGIRELPTAVERFGKAAAAKYLLDQIGKPKQRVLNPAPPNEKYHVKQSSGYLKQAFAVSQYSGDLGPGRFVNYASHIPPFTHPPVKTAGPPSEDKGKKKMSAMRDELAKLNAIASPEAQLHKAQQVGSIKVTAPPGPSIHQIAKPVGFGRPAPGATKGAV